MGIPWLGLVSLCQIWDFFGYSLNTLKYPKWESLIFSCVQFQIFDLRVDALISVPLFFILLIPLGHFHFSYYIEGTVPLMIKV